MNITTTPAVNYISAKELGKHIRLELKAVFPGVKFSVKTTGEIRISYTDGPTDSAVEAIVNKYEGKGFDSYADMATFLDNTVTVNGVEYKVPAVYVFVTRSHSDEFRATMESEIVANLNGREMTPDNIYNAMVGYTGRPPYDMAEAAYLLARTRNC